MGGGGTEDSGPKAGAGGWDSSGAGEHFTFLGLLIVSLSVAAALGDLSGPRSGGLALFPEACWSDPPPGFPWGQGTPV